MITMISACVPLVAGSQMPGQIVVDDADHAGLRRQDEAERDAGGGGGNGVGPDEDGLEDPGARRARSTNSASVSAMVIEMAVAHTA
jgi:hypothetical protein